MDFVISLYAFKTSFSDIMPITLFLSSNIGIFSPTNFLELLLFYTDISDLSNNGFSSIKFIALPFLFKMFINFSFPIKQNFLSK